MLEFATNTRARQAIENAHKERGKVLGEVWRWMTRQLRILRYGACPEGRT